MKAIAKRARSVRDVLGWHSNPQHRSGAARARVSELDTDLSTSARSNQGRCKPQGPEAVAWGVIRREEIPLLTHYGTSYGLFDQWIADYECVLKSDAYRLGEYVGDSVQVTGPLSDVIGGMPVMEVTHLQMLKMKWMR